MSKTATVKWGWVIQDQASVVHGMSFGPDWLKGRRRTGPVSGGMDEVKVRATKADIVRNTYYVYAFADEGSAYSFSSLVTSFASQAKGFIPSGNALYGVNFRKVFVVITGKERPGKTPVAKHRHTHSMPRLARDIATAVMHGK